MKFSKNPKSAACENSTRPNVASDQRFDVKHVTNAVMIQNTETLKVKLISQSDLFQAFI